MNNLIRFLLSASYARVCIQGVAIDPNNPSRGSKTRNNSNQIQSQFGRKRRRCIIIAIVTLSASFDLFFGTFLDSRFSLFSHFIVKDDERRDQRSEPALSCLTRNNLALLI